MKCKLKEQKDFRKLCSHTAVSTWPLRFYIHLYFPTLFKSRKYQLYMKRDEAVEIEYEINVRLLFFLFYLYILWIFMIFI